VHNSRRSLDRPTLKPRSHRARQRASTRVDASNQINVKDSKHSHRQRRRASTNLHTSNKRCQFKLYIGYWTSTLTINGQNVRVRLHHQTTPVLMTSLTMT